MSKFKTVTEERAELLKYQLLSKAQKAKRFYKQSMFQPQTIMSVAQATQRNFYADIDKIGSRIASEDYGDKTADERSYKDTSYNMAQDLMRVIDNQWKAGVLPPQVYNDVMGYMMSTWGVALSGKDKEYVEMAKKVPPTERSEEVKKVIEKQALRMDPIGRLALTQLGKNYTQLSTQQLVNLGSELQPGEKEHLRLWFIEQQKKQPGGLNPYGVSIPGLTNISQPIPQVGQGERVVNVGGYFGPLSFGGSPQIPGAGGIGGAMVTTNPNHLINTESNNMISNDYGLTPDQSKIFDNEVMALLGSPRFAQNKLSLLQKYQKMNPKFRISEANKNISELWKARQQQQQSREAKFNNVVNSAGAKQGEITNALMLQKAETNLTAQNIPGDPGFHTQTSQLASIEQPANNVTPAEHLSSVLNNLKRNYGGGYAYHFFMAILEGGSPPIGDWGIGRDDEDLVGIDMTEDIEAVDFIGIDTDYINSVTDKSKSIPDVKDLEKLRNLITLGELGKIKQLNKENEKNKDYENWDIWDTLKKKPDHMKIVQDIYKRTDEILDKIIGIYEDTYNRYPNVMRIKDKLDGTTMNPNAVFKYMVQEDRKSGYKGLGRKKIGGRQELKYPSRYTEQYKNPGAVGAMTSMVRDPPMRFSVGGDNTSGIYANGRRKKNIHNIVIS